jgi:hypothetical protein
VRFGHGTVYLVLRCATLQFQAQHSTVFQNVKLLPSSDVSILSLLFMRVHKRATSMVNLSGFGGLEVVCWPLVPKFAPGRSRRNFRAKKILSTPFFGGEVKPSVSCHIFTACKISLNVTWKTAFRQNFRTFLVHSFTFRRWVLSRGDTRGGTWWRKLECLNQIAQ